MKIDSLESLAAEMEQLANTKEIAVNNMSAGLWQQEMVVEVANLRRWASRIREALK